MKTLKLTTDVFVGVKSTQIHLGAEHLISAHLAARVPGEEDGNDFTFLPEAFWVYRHLCSSPPNVLNIFKAHKDRILAAYESEITANL